MSWLLRLTVTLLLCSGALAQEPLEVQFAGLAFVTEHQDIGETFPYTQQLVNSQALNAQLWTNLAALDNPALKLTADSLADITRSDSVIVLAIALDGETVSSERIDGRHKLIASLSGQALFFDFKQQTLVASYPIGVERRDNFEVEPTEEQKRESVRALLYGTSENGLIGDAVKKLRNAAPTTHSGARIGLTSVSISPEALTFLPPYLQSNPRRAERMLAQTYIRFLSESHQIALLPYTKGDAIGNRMAMRLANGQVFNLQIPEPDYAFTLHLDRLKKARFGESAAGTSWIYGAAMNVTLTEPLSAKQYLQARVKYGTTKTVPSSQETLDDGPPFNEAMQGLLFELSNAFKQPNSDWARKATDDKSFAEQLAASEKVIQRCK